MKLINVLAVLFWCNTVPAANWYVDTIFTGSNNGTSWENAWQDFSSIDWVPVAFGDTINISGGEQVAYYNDRLVIGEDGLLIRPGQDAGHDGMVYIKGNIKCMYKDSLTIDGKGKFGRNIHVHDTLAETREFKDTSAVDIYRAVKVNIRNIVISRAGSHGIHLNHCWFVHVSNCYISNTWQDAISFGGSPLTYAVLEDSFRARVVDSCIIDSCYDDAIQGGCNYVTISNNRFYYRYGLWPVHTGKHPDAIQIGQYSHHQKIYGNTFVNWPQACFMSMGSGSGWIYNNVFYDNTDEVPSGSTNRALSVNRDTSVTWNGPIIFANNTVYNSVWVAVYLPVPSCGSNQDLIIRNNLFLNCKGWVMGAAYTPSLVSDDNVFYTVPGSPGATDYPDSGLNVDPLVVDYDNYDFALEAASPVRNAGTNLSQYFTTDRNGNPRPAEGAWAIGAYQYESVDVTSPMPNLQHPRFSSVLSNPWGPEAGCEIINLTGKRVAWQKTQNGIYLVRKSADGLLRKVLVKR